MSSPVGAYAASRPQSQADVISNSVALGVGVAASLWAIWVGRRTPAPTVVQKGMVATFAITLIGVPSLLLAKFGSHAIAHAVLETQAGNRFTGGTAAAAGAIRDHAVATGRGISRVTQSAWTSAAAGFHNVKSRVASYRHAPYDQTLVLKDDEAEALYHQQAGKPSRWIETAGFRNDHDNPEPVHMKDGILRLRGCYLRVDRTRRLPRDQQPAVLVEVGYVKNNAPNPGNQKKGAEFDTVIRLRHNPLVPDSTKVPLTLDVSVLNEHASPPQPGPYQWRLQAT